MKASVCVIRVDFHQLVAAEVDNRRAAEFLDAGQPVLLATPPELTKLARRRNRALVVFTTQTLQRLEDSLEGTGRTAGRLAGQHRQFGRPALVRVA